MTAFVQNGCGGSNLRMLNGGYLQYVGLGATHMLTGYDHLLFLFGVVFFLTSSREVIKFVTVFTTFFKITWNYYLIDAIIAISVMYKTFDNNGGFQKMFQVESPNLLWAVFGCADARRDALVKSGKLHASWGSIKHEKIEQVDGKKGKEWKLSYKNPASPEKDRAALHMFFTPPGNFIVANHSGQ